MAKEAGIESIAIGLDMEIDQKLEDYLRRERRAAERPMRRRYALAFVAGLVINAIVTLKFVYDGLGSVIVQTLSGLVAATFGLIVVVVLGRLFRIESRWATWKKWQWIPLLIMIFGTGCLLAAWLPQVRTTAWDPEWNQVDQSPNWKLCWSGWLAIMFGVANCPVTPRTERSLTGT